MGLRTRWKATAALMLSAGLFATSACGATSPQNDQADGANGTNTPTPVRIATTADAFGSLFYVAKSEGYFADNQIQPKIQIFQNGIQGLDSVIGGQADVNISLGYPTMTRLGKGRISILGGVGVSAPGFHKFAVRDSISELKDLKGKRLGILPGANQAYITSLVLDKAGLSKSDVTQVPFDGLLTLSSALIKGDIDAAWVYLDAYNAVKTRSNIKILFDNTAVFDSPPGIYLLGSNRFIDQSEALNQRLIKSLTSAAKFIQKNPDDAAASIADQTHGDQTSIKALIEANDWHLFMNEDLLQELRSLKEFGMQSGSFTVDNTITDYLSLNALRDIAPDAVSVKAGS